MANVKWYQEHSSQNNYYKQEKSGIILVISLINLDQHHSFQTLEHIQEIFIACIKVCIHNYNINNEITRAANPTQLALAIEETFYQFVLHR